MCSLRRQRPVPLTSQGVCEKLAVLYRLVFVRKANEGKILLTSQLLRSVGVLHRDGDFPDSSAAFGRCILNNPTEMNPCPASIRDELGNSRIGEASWVAICGGRLLEIDGVRKSLNLSYGTSVELNQVIEEKLPGRPSQSHLRLSAEWGFMLLTLEQTPVKIQTQLDFHGQRETLPWAGILTLLQNISIVVDMTHRYAESQFISAHRLISTLVSPPGAVAFTHVPSVPGIRLVDATWLSTTPTAVIAPRSYLELPFHLDGFKYSSALQTITSGSWAEYRHWATSPPVLMVTMAVPSAFVIMSPNSFGSNPELALFWMLNLNYFNGIYDSSNFFGRNPDLWSKRAQIFLSFYP
ncbi:hypothetical protein B0H13DRAFT_1857070 [Mycena leptocephala]|nr:hypothetical protein B0H13DRAFT_1857070 [Mycena leptocephala]